MIRMISAADAAADLAGRRPSPPHAAAAHAAAATAAARRRDPAPVEPGLGVEAHAALRRLRDYAA